jgi:hypothetical protein
MKITTKLLGPAIMSFMVVFIVTGFVIWLNIGFSEDFLSRWVKSWLFGWPIATLSIIILTPIGTIITTYILNKWLGDAD